MDRRLLPLWAQIILEDSPVPLALARRHGDSAPKKSVREHTLTAEQSVHSVPKSCLVLMAHGSKDPRWRGTFECLYEYVTTRFGDNIRLAYMEFVGPTLLDVARECHAVGVRSMRVLPLFMAGGAHVATDIPEQMEQVRREFPGMTVEAMPPIGEDPRMFAVIQEIIGEHARSLRNGFDFTSA